MKKNDPDFHREVDALHRYYLDKVDERTRLMTDAEREEIAEIERRSKTASAEVAKRLFGSAAGAKHLLP